MTLCPAKNRFDRYAEQFSDIEHSSERWTLQTTFKLSDVTHVITQRVCQRLLSNSIFDPQFSQSLPECFFGSP